MRDGGSEARWANRTETVWNGKGNGEDQEFGPETVVSMAAGMMAVKSKARKGQGNRISKSLVWNLLARHGAGRKTDRRRLEMWQGLKPNPFFAAYCSTTEVMPFYKAHSVEFVR